MARKVMQRVMEMIETQSTVDPALLRQILQIEQVYVSRDGSGAKEKLQALIAGASKLAVDK